MAAMGCSGGGAKLAMASGGGMRRRKYRPVVPKSTFTAYMDEGLMHLKKMSHRKAKHCFDAALELKPDDPLALISRSQCNLNLGHHEEALKDAERTFIVDKNFTPGLYQFGEVLFSLGFFERALVYYHRGHRLRKTSIEFLSGIAKSEDAIRTAILDRAGTQIEDINEILPLIDEIETEDSQVKHQCCIRPIEAETLLENRKPLLPPKNRTREHWVTREILKDLAHHKFFASRNLRRLSDPSMQIGHNTTIRDNMAEILYFLEHHERLLRYMKPMYYRIYGLNFNMSTVTQYEQEKLEGQSQRVKLIRAAMEGALLKTVSRIEQSLANGRNSDGQMEAERCIRLIQKMSSHAIPRKGELLMDLTHYRGIAFMRQKLYDEAADAFKKESKMAQKFSSDAVISRSLDFLARSYALKGNFNEAAETWESRLEYAKTALEKIYTFHEIGRSLLEQGKRELSRYYANQAVALAEETNSHIWSTFGKILLAQIELKANNYQESLDQFEAAKVSSEQDPSHKSTVIGMMLDEIAHHLKLCIERVISTTRYSSGTDEEDNDNTIVPSTPA